MATGDGSNAHQAAGDAPSEEKKKKEKKRKVRFDPLTPPPPPDTFPGTRVIGC